MHIPGESFCRVIGAWASRPNNFVTMAAYAEGWGISATGTPMAKTLQASDLQHPLTAEKVIMDGVRKLLQ